MTVRHPYLGDGDQSDDNDNFGEHCHDGGDDDDDDCDHSESDYDDDVYDDDNKPDNPSQRKAISPPSIESQIIRGR